jgi:hypothetical protein
MYTSKEAYAINTTAVSGAVTAQYNQKAWFTDGSRESAVKSRIGIAKNAYKPSSDIGISYPKQEFTHGNISSRKKYHGQHRDTCHSRAIPFGSLCNEAGKMGQIFLRPSIQSCNVIVNLVYLA